MITIKSTREIELMREAGHIVALCHQEISKIIKPGITSLEINDLCEKIIRENDAIPSFLGYSGFPYAVCSSPNEQVVHGFANDVPLKNGDIISVDIGATYKGYVGDSAWTYRVGEVSSEVENLLVETENALFKGLEAIKDGNYVGDISHAIEKHAKANKLGVVREFAGHGVGANVHEMPEILNYGKPKSGPMLKAGMTIAVEPMLNLGTHRIKFHNDGWTTTTADKKYSAHYEHTVLVTKDGYEILTKLKES